MADVEVRIDEIKDAAVKLLDALAASGEESIKVPFDFYWSLPKASRYNPYQEPKDMTLGQISADIEELRRIAKGEMPPTLFALVWLAAVLQAIGETTVE